MKKPLSKNRKYGRNKAKCARYRDLGKRVKNVARRIKRHLKKHPEDLQSQAALDTLS